MHTLSDQDKYVEHPPLADPQSDLAMRLARRVPKSPEDFEQALQLAEQRYCAGNYKPEMPAVEELEPGAFYLVEVDARYRRAYARKPLAQ